MFCRSILLLAVVLYGAQFTFAQDKVHLKNGTVYEGKVTLIEPEKVTLSQGDDKPLRTFLKSEIRVIVFSDGSVETFDDYNKHKEMRSLGVRYAPIKLKSPGTAALWSVLGGAILPIQGLGQFYNGQLIKGFAFLGIGLFSYSAMYSGIRNDDDNAARNGAIIYLVSWVVSTVDAYISAKRINTEQLSLKPTSFSNGVGLTMTVNW